MLARSYSSGAEALFDLTGVLHNDGDRVTVRGQHTRELRNVMIEITDPEDVLSTGMNRRMNLALGYAEGLQLIGGFSDPVRLERIAPNTAMFQDGGSFHGAYGPRIKMQLPRVAEKLRVDPSTRQAVATIWDPLHDLMTERSNDYPCTIGFNFSIRDGKLNMSTHMRSNDVWWGWTYDVVQFCMLQVTMAYHLGWGVGTYTHYVDSFHMYERDQAAIMSLKEPEAKCTRAKIGPIPGRRWADIQDLSRELFLGEAMVGSEWLNRLNDTMDRYSG